MREYNVLRTGSAEIPALPIDQVAWSAWADVSAQAQLTWDEDGLYVTLRAREAAIRAEEQNPLGQPCEDSCMEFFFSPAENDSRYFNLEVSASGCVYFGIGHDRHDLMRIFPGKRLQVETERTPDGWCARYCVPISVIRVFFPECRLCSGAVIRANLYKCGDKTQTPHYFSWNPMSSEKPDFHRSQDFGLLHLI